MFSASGSEEGEGLARGWTRWLERLLPGSVACPVPSAATSLLTWLSAVKPDALVLTGGEDVGDDPPRDSAERQLLAFCSGSIPILGVCRGAQVMNLWRDGQLTKCDSARHAGTRHGLTLTPRMKSSWNIEQQGLEVNSYHWNVIPSMGLGQGLHALAIDDDQSVEAFEDSSGMLLGVMWHPEREIGVDALQDSWFATYLSQGVAT